MPQVALLGHVHYAYIFCEHFSETKALSIIRAFEWHFSGNQVLFSQKIKIESFLKRYDDFKNNLKNYIQISPLYSYVDDHFAMLKVSICIHSCHTTYTFLLALNPLKMFRINKKRR